MERISAEVICSQRVRNGCERHATAWVKHLLDNSDRLVPDLTCKSDLVVSALQEGVILFQFSLDNKPDGVVLCAFSCS